MVSEQQTSRRVSHLSSFSLSKTFSRLSTTAASDAGEILPGGSLGLHRLHVPPAKARVDLIFVHGLGGDARKTWSKAGQNFWPQDWLPADPAFQHVRIHTYGYDSAYLKGGDDCLNIHHMGKALLSEVSTSPDIIASKTRLIAVGHSMGGLVIKKMYILAKQDAAYRDIAARFSAIYFLATPHRGADSAKLLSNILKALHERAYVSDLSRNSGAIQVINEEFRHIYEGLELWSFYETQTMKRFSSPIVSPESAVLGYREEKQVPMSADHRSICKFESPSDANYLVIRNSLASTLLAIAAQTSETEVTHTRAQIRELRKYLGVPEVLDDDFLTAKEARMGDSCRWILARKDYVRWKDTTSADGRVLWLKGLPAAGKSVLAAFVADELQQSGQACSYFFFRHADKSKTRLGTCLRSLALQTAMSNRDVRDAILQLRGDEIHLGDADEQTLWRSLFVNIILQYITTPLFWVIDALDECANSATLLDAILPSLSELSSSLRILITSRDTLELNRGFKILPPSALSILTISVADTRPDLDLIIRTEVEALSVVLSTERPPLIEALLQKSKGSFLWTILVLKELSLCHSKKEIDNVLEEIPKGMQSFYKRTLDLMGQAPRGKELARSVLVWAACAVRPLSVGELSGALLYDIDDSFPKLGESIATLCGQLVAVDRTGRVQMVHETAREFLLDEKLDSEFAVNFHNAHARMAMTCLRYLISEEMKPPRTARRRTAAAAPSKRSELSIYASAAFSQHLALVDSSAIEELLLLLVQFMKSNILTWIESVAVSQDLNQLIHTAKRLRKFLGVCSAENSPLDPQIQTVRQWSIDLTRIAAKFANALIASPAAIYSLVPPLCPTGSMIHRTGGKGRGLTVAKVSVEGEQWDDRLLSVSFDGPTTVICYSDEFLAVGLQTGAVILYYVTSHEQYRTVQHGERVKHLVFKGKSSGLLVTCGFKMIKVWNLKTGTMTYELNSPPRPMAIAFEGPKLLVASQKGYLRCWTFSGETVASESMFDTFWSDSPVDDGDPGHQPRPRGAPSAFDISAAQRMLAVVYSGQPVCLWDLEEDAYFGVCGKRLPSGELSSHRVVAMTFNPHPGIPLLAVAYLDGDLVILDPFVDEQLECVRAQCHTLAASPDGRLLAAGTGNGIVDIYKFDTLKLLCRIRSSIAHVKQISFSMDSLRLADIRGTQCTVWEPAALMRGLTSDDSSSIMPASVVDTTFLDTSSRITAMVYAPELDLIVCGKDDGVLVMHDLKTAAVLATCRSHKVRILHLRWCQSQRAVLSADASSTMYLQRIQMKGSGKRTPEMEIEVLFRTSLASEWSITNLLVAEDNKLLVSTSASDHLFSIEGILIAEQSYGIGEGPRWIRHPSSPAHLLGLAARGQVHVHSWAGWLEVPSFSSSMSGGIDLPQLKTAWEFQLQGHPHVLLEYSDMDGSTKTSHVAVLQAESIADSLKNTMTTREHEIVDHSLAAKQEEEEDEDEASTTLEEAGLSLTPLPALSSRIAHIIGTNDRGALIFLDHDYWVCSCDVKAALATDKQANSVLYTRHCFIPFEWLAGRRDIICCIVRGSIVFARTSDIVIVRGYSEFCELVRG